MKELEIVERAEISKNEWKAQFYDSTVNYVTKYGEDILELLAPKEGEQILDLGCGTGHLTEKIAQQGAKVIGIDFSENMIEEAQRLYSHLDFQVQNAEHLQLDEKVDAVFSNAALHWMKNASAVTNSVANCLKQGGRFVAEFGGQDNVAVIIEALYQALGEKGIKRSEVYHPWYFPSVGEYTSLLEASGFTVRYVLYFDRPTLLEDCPRGVEDWIRNFAGDFVQSVSPELREEVIQRAAELTKPQLFQEGQWFADYCRLRFVAVKK